MSGTIGAVALAVVMLAFDWFTDTASQGMDAKTKALIDERIEDKLKLDSGATYGAELTSIGNRLTAIETSQSTMSTDIRDIRNAVVSMAGGGSDDG